MEGRTRCRISQLAEKTEVINTKTFLLSFKQFTLEIDLDIQRSLQFTKRFSHHGADFLFAVAELWLRVGAGRYLISPKTEPGNFFEDIRGLSASIVDPPTVDDLQGLIDCGGWCPWMAGYWSRLTADASLPSDEDNYEKLIRLSMIESRVGHLAIYRYGQSSVIEVATRSDEYNNEIAVWECFESSSLKMHLDMIVDDMAKAIRGGC